jgi:hypothetical protein
MPDTYTIYYGWLIDDRQAPNAEAKRIAAARLPLLICEFWTSEFNRRQNASAKVLSLMRDAKTQVYAHVATNWGDADLEDVKRRAAECLDKGADGIFFDEAADLMENNKLDYYQQLMDLARSKGRRVILNPGTAKIGAGMGAVADLMMVGHEWRRLAADCPWAGSCGDRLMGVSRNDRGGMGYTVDAETAVRDTKEAWALGIGLHTSTDKFSELPAWYESYVAAVKS